MSVRGRATRSWATTALTLSTVVGIVSFTSCRAPATTTAPGERETATASVAPKGDEGAAASIPAVGPSFATQPPVAGVTPKEGCYEDEPYGADGCAAASTCVIVAIEDPPGDPGDSECVPVSCLGGEEAAGDPKNRPLFDSFERLLECPEYAAMHPDPEGE